jgi:hypothetical protein
LIEMANKFFIGLASFAMLLQTIPLPTDGSPIASTAEHLTLTGALIVAVVVLWRSNVKKDELVLKTTEQVTAALATAASSNVELRKTNEALVEQVSALKAAVNGKGAGA